MTLILNMIHLHNPTHPEHDTPPQPSLTYPPTGNTQPNLGPDTKTTQRPRIDNDTDPETNP